MLYIPSLVIEEATDRRYNELNSLEDNYQKETSEAYLKLKMLTDDYRYKKQRIEMAYRYEIGLDY